MAAPSSAAPCGLCAAAAAPYTCPRCNLRLCSLGCYRSHGGCAEAFYRRQVLEALQTERHLPAGRDRLASALRRLRLSGEAGDEEGPAGRGAAGRLLSGAERAELQRLIASGEAAQLLPPWRPWWWRRRRAKRLVVELGKEEEEEEEEDEEDLAAPTPPLPASPPALSSLRSSPLSPLLPFQLPNVLYGYAFALSLHAGDEKLLPELPAAAVAVSAALRSSRSRFASTSQALHIARQDSIAAGYPRCPLGDSGTVLAVVELLEGRRGTCRDVTIALGHLEGLLRKGKRRLGAGEEEQRKRFDGARRKCRFLGAWSREEEAQRVLEGLGREAREVWEELVEVERGWEGGRRGSGEGEALGGHWEGLELDWEEGRRRRRSPLGSGKREGRRLIEELER